MALTPSSVDPRRKEQLERKKKAPGAWGAQGKAATSGRPKDWTPGKGLRPPEAAKSKGRKAAEVLAGDAPADNPDAKKTSASTAGD